MANRRVLVKRRDATRNIRKITRTMQLIATARFQAAHKAAVSRRPYTDKLTELTGHIAGAVGDVTHALMEAREEERRTAVLVLTSMRGLCGGYNSHVLRHSLEHVGELEGRGVAPVVHMVGGKGIAFYRFLGRELHRRIDSVSDIPRFEEVEPIGSGLIADFVGGEIDAVDVIYTKFFSASRQRPVTERLLPLRGLMDESAKKDAEKEREGSGPAVEYELSPSPEELLDELLPASVRIRLFQAFTDAAVSEQIARMVAMTAATDAAGDMIKRLTQQYNRARQTQITLELLDIVGGANALAG